jgi:magnesium transporter
MADQISARSCSLNRDLRDNLLRIEQTAAGFADELLVSFDLYLNKSASQANEGIKVLTALTAITHRPRHRHVYGMNFQHIRKSRHQPATGWHWV